MYVDRIEITDLDEREYASAIPAVRQIGREGLDFTSPVTFFVGENGSGKSTLTEAIAAACGFNPEGGTKSFRFSTADTHSGLAAHIRVIRRAFARDGFFLRAESFYNAVSYIDELDRLPSAAPPIIDSYGGKSLHQYSHGESFLTLVTERFHGNSLFILDEPEAALSPQRQLALLCEIDRLTKEGSQFIIATHSPILIAYPGATVFELSENGIAGTDYRDTATFSTVRDFIESPERMLHYLLRSDN